MPQILKSWELHPIELCYIYYVDVDNRCIYQIGVLYQIEITLKTTKYDIFESDNSKRQGDPIFFFDLHRHSNYQQLLRTNLFSEFLNIETRL